MRSTSASSIRATTSATALYESAEQYARRAVAANPNDAEGHFQLARAIGRNALTMGARDKMKYAGEVRDEALAALKIDPKHAGALHVMGVWNAEVMRLNGFTRMIAKNLLGGKVFGEASWDNAQRYLEAGGRDRAEPHHAPPRPRRGVRGPRQQGEGDRAVRVDRQRADRRTTTIANYKERGATRSARRHLR